MFNNNPYYQQMNPTPAYQRQAFQNQPYQQLQAFQQPMQQPMMQDGMLQARFVSGREEAVASNVIPGSMFLFFDRANRKIYSKLIDPQTGMPDFREYGEMQPEQAQQPQYVTFDVLDAFRQEIDQRLAAFQPRQSQRKAVNSNDE